MALATFADLLEAACNQPQPQRLLLVSPPPSVEVAAWRDDAPKGAASRTVTWSRQTGRPSVGLVELSR